MIAVLHDALDCVEKHRFAENDHDRQLFRDAAQWILAEQPNWLYSFECICGVLNLDVNAVRKHMRVVRGI